MFTSQWDGSGESINVERVPQGRKRLVAEAGAQSVEMDADEEDGSRLDASKACPVGTTSGHTY
ncbi:hypothetical protein PCCS19_59030 [Paenibacillus sp. CCS19]|uniref:hypothetical protein n=1 Tax=Paenibacillus sp. CCS19 TaxID=3158387 RepID=UPI00256C01B7|nr:hypothetical protein [Paenibacillus cellulosilyticus]GMK42843.1 hypothetical protein PCCS19_59030 [Paenibacillus cellulosilyticus]